MCACCLSFGRDVIGRVHPDTEPALAMLREEGFKVVDMIDIFDGGPVVSCQRDEIAAVRRTVELPVIEIADHLDAPESILASRQGGFRAMIGPARQTDTGIIIPDIVALTLGVREGDPVALLAPKAVL